MSHSEKQQQFKNALVRTEEVRSMERRVANLEEAFDHNTTLFLETLVNLEMRVNLVVKVLNDLVASKLVVKGVDAIDWDHYHAQYVSEQEQEATEEEQPDEEKLPEDIASACPANVVILGGDK